MKLKLTRPILSLDIETTGLDVEKDRIVEISLVKLGLDDGRDARTRLVNPGIPIPQSATDEHGITDDDVKDCPTFAQLAGGILDFMSDCDICGYNSNSFDIRMLNNEFIRAGKEWDYSGINFVDACVIARRMEPRSLTWAKKFYCFDEYTGAHRAEADANAAIDVLLAQIERYKVFPETCFPDTVKELALFSNYDSVMLDISGKFKMNEAGKIVFAFGPHRDKEIASEPGFLQWMIGKDFAADTKRLVRKILADEN